MKENDEPINTALPDNSVKLSEQEKVIMDAIMDSGKLISNYVEKLLNLKNRRVHVILKEMTDKDLLVKLGSARNTYYEEKYQ